MAKTAERRRARKPARKTALWGILLTDRRRLGQPVRAISRTGGMTVRPHRTKLFRSWQDAAAYLKRWRAGEGASPSALVRRRRFLPTIDPLLFVGEEAAGDEDL